jgi:hypothetical protein
VEFEHNVTYHFKRNGCFAFCILSTYHDMSISSAKVAVCRRVNKCDMRASATEETSIMCLGRVVFCLLCRQKGQYGRRSG